MNHYTTARGLESVKLICNKFKDSLWVLPDLICDDVLKEITSCLTEKEHFYYHVRDDFSFDMDCTNFDDKECVFYTIDYFGLEHQLGYIPEDVVVIRDGVWFDRPIKPVAANEIWFNSYRKIAWPWGTGSDMISAFDLGADPKFKIESNTNSGDVEIDWEYRRKNYKVLKHLLNGFSVDYTPTHPSLFPFRLKNRDEILKQLPIQTPRMWSNKYGLPNDLYNELAFIPLDERYSSGQLIELADQIHELGAVK